MPSESENGQIYFEKNCYSGIHVCERKKIAYLLGQKEAHNFLADKVLKENLHLLFVVSMLIFQRILIRLTGLASHITLWK